MSTNEKIEPATRREFMKHSTAAAVGGTLAATLASARAVHAGADDKIRIGLIGCGGRGNGAASDALHAGPDIQLVALADAFPEQLKHGREVLKTQFPNQVSVDDSHCFVGLDAYKQLLASDVDVVLLATPPGFRPLHFRAAVEANKHVFAEKPMATDAVGVRSIMESVELSKKKNLSVAAGFCWRYHNIVQSLFEKIHTGSIGDLRCVYGTYLTNPVKPMPAATSRPEGMSDLEWMVRNWYNFTWLSGDGFVEQAIHTVDWLAWAFQDNPPISCNAVGGRQIPSPGGNIFDHMHVNYVWKNDARGFVAQRQIPNCYGENALYALGSKGVAQILQRKDCVVSGETNWKSSGPANNMMLAEHDAFFKSIRSSKPINNGDRMATSTLMGIMGRMAAYTGQEVTWEMAMNSQESLVPALPDGWKTNVPMPRMAMPGVTPFV